MSSFYSRKTPRAQWHDYGSESMYFVTICTQDRKHYFGEIVDKTMILNEVGKICDQEIIHLGKRKGVDIHSYVVMPNHIHILLRMDAYEDDIHNDQGRDASSMRPQSSMRPVKDDTLQDGLLNRPYRHGYNVKRPYQGPTLGSIIKLFKGHVTKHTQKQGFPFSRQSRYHDKIVRDQIMYDNIIHYIHTNPEKRGEDKHYTDQ